MVFMNYMKNSLASIFKWLVAWKQGLPRPKVSNECLSPSLTLSYTITKNKKRIFCDANVIEGPEAPDGPIRVRFRFHSDRVFFRFLSDRVIFRVLSDKTLLWVLSDRLVFQSPVIGSSSGFLVIDFSLESSVVISRHAAIFYQSVQLLFLLKGDVLFYIKLSKWTSHLTISSEKNEEILAWYRHEILYWKYMPWISRFPNYLYSWIYTSYILHKKLNKILQEPDWPLKITLFFLPSFVFIRFTTPYHSLSLIVIICHHSLSFVVTEFSTRCSLSLVVIRCHSLYHSLSFVASLVVVCCHSMYHSSVFL